jgi:hypothetical protein
MIEKTMNALDFNAIMTMTMGDNKGAKNKKTFRQSYIGVGYEDEFKIYNKQKCKSAQRSYNLIVH